MKLHDVAYEDAGVYMIRVPMFSAEQCLEILEKDLSQEAFDQKLREICLDPVFREAVLIASPNLYKKIKQFIAQGIDNTKKMEDFRISVLKYFIRMCTRTTPFGIFSQVAKGVYGGEPGKKGVVSGSYKRAREDFEWLMKIVKEIERENYKHLKYTTNHIVAVKQGRIYLPYITDGDETEVTLRYTKPVKAVVEACQKSIYSYDALVQLIKGEYPAVPIEKIENLIKELVEKEVLISLARPPLSQRDQLLYVIENIEKIPPLSARTQALRQIWEGINRYNQMPIGEGENVLYDILERMRTLKEAPCYLQVDAAADVQEKILSENDRKDLEQVIQFLFFLSKRKKDRHTIYDEYKMDFLEKYGEDREVSLQEMLDNDIGIGAPYSYSHPFAGRLRKKPAQGDSDKKISDYFGEKYIRACKKGGPILLDHQMVEALELDDEVQDEDLPMSLEINFLCKEVEGEKRYYLGPNVGSNGAGKTFGRFAHISQEFFDICEQLNQKEEKLQSPQEVFCELMYIPQKMRYANVARNSSNRSCELVLYTNGADETKKQIDISDIFVGVQNNKFYLKSRKMNKLLKIRTNNMLNTISDTNLVRFLKEIETDGVLEWSDFQWNTIFRDLPHIPEIRYKNFVLSSETWRLRPEALHSADKYEVFNKKFEDYVKENDIPSFVYMSEGDNRLLMNLSNSWCKKIIYKTFRQRKEITLTACEEGAECICDCTGKAYNCEVVVPWIKAIHPSEKSVLSAGGTSTEKILDVPSDIRCKMFGSDWLYVKLYGSGNATENLIMYYIKPFAEDFLKENKVKRYFFMRYADPEFHIRLRFQSPDILKYSQEIAMWLQDLREQGVIARYEIGCYDREIERYGGMYGIEIAEEIFLKDSQIAQELLLMEKEGTIKCDKELVGTVIVVTYMEQFGWDFSRQLKWLETLVHKTDYREEYNKKRRTLEKSINSGGDWENIKESLSGRKLIDLFELRASSVGKYPEAIKKGLITTSEETILGSLIHLSFNRLFGIDREFEKRILSYTRHALYALRYTKERKVEN